MSFINTSLFTTEKMGSLKLICVVLAAVIFSVTGKVTYIRKTFKQKTLKKKVFSCFLQIQNSESRTISVIEWIWNRTDCFERSHHWRWLSFTWSISIHCLCCWKWSSFVWRIHLQPTVDCHGCCLCWWVLIFWFSCLTDKYPFPNSTFFKPFNTFLSFPFI